MVGFAAAGFLLGEIIMALTVLAPNLKGSPPPPMEAQVMRLLVGSIFFGPFGMAAGSGIGLLVAPLVRRPPARREDSRVK
jgi:hypothetical protein